MGFLDEIKNKMHLGGQQGYDQGYSQDDDYGYDDGYDDGYQGGGYSGREHRCHQDYADQLLHLECPGGYRYQAPSDAIRSCQLLNHLQSSASVYYG